MSSRQSCLPLEPSSVRHVTQKNSPHQSFLWWVGAIWTHIACMSQGTSLLPLPYSFEHIKIESLGGKLGVNTYDQATMTVMLFSKQAYNEWISMGYDRNSSNINLGQFFDWILVLGLKDCPVSRSTKGNRHLPHRKVSTRFSNRNSGPISRNG